MNKLLTFFVLAFFALCFCQSKIEDSVWHDLSLHGGKANVLILMTNTGNLHQLKTKTKGMTSDQIAELVVSTKMKVAQTQQAPLISLLEKEGLAYTSYWVANCIGVSAATEKFLREISLRDDVMTITTNADFGVPLLPEETEDTLAVDKNAHQQTPEWNVRWIKADKVWEKGFTGKGIVTGNMDTGIHYLHRALVTNYRGNKGNNTFDHNYNWFDGLRNYTRCGTCACKHTAPCDDQGHGSHCMGTASGGVDRKIGVAPGSKWMGCRAFSDRARIAAPTTFINCLQFFAAPTDSEGNNPRPDLRPHTTSHSYGCPNVYCPNSEVFKQAFEVLKMEGVFAAVSAGNSGPGCSTINRPPGHMEVVYSVGASNTNSTTIASFSSRGPIRLDNSGRGKPDITAPGVAVWSSTNTASGYSAYSGTSMASPAVNGAVALLWEAVPRLKRNVDDTIEILNLSAHKMNVTNQCSSSGVPNNVYGYGILDIEAAVDLAISVYGRN